MANDSVAFVIFWLALSLLLSSSLVPCLSFFFFFGSDVTKPLCLSRKKPVAALYWADYHAPSVGAIRDARAHIQGPVTCPAGEWRGAAGWDGTAGPGAEWGNEGWEGDRGGVQKESREGPLGVVAGPSRGATLHPLLPRPEGRRAGGWGSWRGWHGEEMGSWGHLRKMLGCQDKEGCSGWWSFIKVNLSILSYSFIQIAFLLLRCCI